MSDEKSIPFEAVPVITLSLDRLKMSVMHMIDPELMRQAIEGRLENAIASFDFDSRVKTAADACIKECIEEYFGYCGNGKKIIKDAVYAALDDAFKKSFDPGR